MFDLKTFAGNLIKAPSATIYGSIGVVGNSAEGMIDRICRLRYFPLKKDGIMVEVGAAHPTHLSAGNYFRRIGWRVVSVEPNPEYAEMHRRAGRPIHEVACASFDRDDVTFQMVVHPDGGCSPYSAFSAIEVTEAMKGYDKATYDRTVTRDIKISVRKLDTILKAEGIDHVDFLMVDVEGWEIEVMAGLTIDPAVVILENNLRCDEYRNYMAKRGYRYIFGMFPNEVYRKNG